MVQSYHYLLTEQKKKIERRVQFKHHYPLSTPVPILRGGYSPKFSPSVLQSNVSFTCLVHSSNDIVIILTYATSAMKTTVQSFTTLLVTIDQSQINPNQVQVLELSRFSTLPSNHLDWYIFQFSTLCFGILVFLHTPGLHQGIFSRVWALGRGIHLRSYLDDWLIMAESIPFLLKHWELLLHLFQDLGIVIS